MEIDTGEALRYLGVRGEAPAGLAEKVRAAAGELTALVRPRYVFRVFRLEQENGALIPAGSGLRLTGTLAASLLEGCGQAALLACTLGADFDALLRREQARDMERALILDACGSALAEAGCGEAERELLERLPGKYLTDRFSPGYGDLPLELQSPLCAALDAPRRLGLTVTESFLLNPMKSVTAVIGVADSPRMARIRGCGYCALKETCALRKGGKSCAL